MHRIVVVAWLVSTLSACAAPEEAARGEDCTDVPCEEGLVCFGSCESRDCSAPDGICRCGGEITNVCETEEGVQARTKALGDDDGLDEGRCREDLDCSDGEICASSYCRAQAGASCDANEDCASLMCDVVYGCR